MIKSYLHVFAHANFDNYRATCRIKQKQQILTILRNVTLEWHYLHLIYANS